MFSSALIAMAVAVLAHHLGLSEAISEAFSKIASCPKCCGFWCTLAVLLAQGQNVFVAIALSMLMAYLSHYFGIVLMLMQKMYDWLWKITNRKSKSH